MTTEEENFQVWLEKNSDRPLSDEVERLQDALKRSETMHAADTRRLQREVGMVGIGPQMLLGVWVWWLSCSGT